MEHLVIQVTKTPVYRVVTLVPSVSEVDPATGNPVNTGKLYRGTGLTLKEAYHMAYRNLKMGLDTILDSQISTQLQEHGFLPREMFMALNPRLKVWYGVSLETDTLDNQEGQEDREEVMEVRQNWAGDLWEIPVAGETQDNRETFKTARKGR